MKVSSIDKSLLPTDLDNMIRPVPLVDGASYQVPVAAGSVLHRLASELFFALDQMAVKDLQIAETDIQEAFDYLLAARCAYVSGLVKLEQHPKDIEYPSLLFPILSAVGRYIDTHLNIEIIPCPEIGYQGAIEVDPNDPHRLIPNKGVKLKVPEKFGLVMSTFRAYGVNTARGLPMDKDIDSDDIFRLDEVEGALMGGKKEPSSHALYARAMLEMSYLATLYGQARVSYLALDSLRSGLYDLVARHVRGPSRRVDH